MSELVLYYKNKELNRWPTEKSPLIVGRGAYADICIKSPAVSESHCLIEIIDNTVTVTDLSSESGIKVNGKLTKKSRLQEGDSLTIGTYTISLVADNSDSGFLVTSDKSDINKTMHRDMQPELSKWEEKKWSINIRGKDSNRNFKLTKKDYILGSAEDCDIHLAGWKISKNHAVFLQEGQKLKIVNVSEKKEIKANGESIRSRRFVSGGDVITIGPYQITVVRN